MLESRHRFETPLLLLGLIIIAVLIGTQASAQAIASTPADQALEALLESSFEAFLQLDPTFAASTGDRRAFGRLTVDLDPAYRQKLRSFSEQALRDLDTIKHESLSPRHRIFADAFREAQHSRLELLQFPDLLLPLKPGWGFTSRFTKMATGAGDLSFDTIQDHEAFLARVDDLERWIDLAIEGMRQGIKVKVVHPKTIVQRQIIELDSQLDPDAAKKIFGEPLKTLPRDLDAEDREVWARHLKASIEEGVIPAYARLREFLVKTYLPQSRESISLAELPDGKAWYGALVKAYTGTNLTPEEIFTLGEQESRRIHRQIDVLQRRLPNNGPSLASRWKAVRDRFSKLDHTVRGRLPELFHRVPEARLEVRQVEAFRADSTSGAFYERPAPDGSRPGVFYVNLTDGRFNLGTSEALFLHEALPGHHFQIADALERTDLPRFLRFGYIGAYVEGWGLYAESLGRDLGLYRSPQQHLGRLHFELGRAGRLVADIGIHYFGWSRKRAESELGRRQLGWAVQEIDRYTNVPGQALSYKIGELRILELRRRAEKALGSKFDVRDFHHQILETGPIPMSVLERKIDYWIASRSAS